MNNLVPKEFYLIDNKIFQFLEKDGDNFICQGGQKPGVLTYHSKHGIPARRHVQALSKNDFAKARHIKFNDKVVLGEDFPISGANKNLANQEVKIGGFKWIDSASNARILPIFKHPSGWSVKNESNILASIDTDGQYQYVELSEIKKWNLDKPTASSFKTQLKSDAIDAAWRVGATQSTKATKHILVAAAKKYELSSPAIKLLADLLDSEFGEALIAFAAGHSLHHIKNDKATKLAKELRVHGMTLGGNMLMDNVLSMLQPELMEILKSLPETQENIIPAVEEIVENEIEDEELEDEVFYGRS
jgi:hypothetical protein